MDTKFIEACNEEHGKKFNWGKFLVARFTEEEWARRCRAPLTPPIQLLDAIGWSRRHVIVFDLQTCEGAGFLPGGFPKADLEKHKIWVCPMFEPFLEWLYQQNLDDLSTLPNYVDLKDAPSSLQGYRRKGRRIDYSEREQCRCAFQGMPNGRHYSDCPFFSETQP